MARRPPTQKNSKDTYRVKGRGEQKGNKDAKNAPKSGSYKGGSSGGRTNAGNSGNSGSTDNNGGGGNNRNAGNGNNRNAGNGNNRNAGNSGSRGGGNGSSRSGRNTGRGGENGGSNRNSRYTDGYSAKDLGKLQEAETRTFKKNNNNRVHYDNDFIFWCRECNLPLIGETCGLCGSAGEKITLSQPADVRFAQGYDYDLIEKHMLNLFSCNPLKGRVLLLNKIPGDDQSLEIIADGRVVGTLRFDLKILDFVFEPSLEGSKLFFNEPYNFASAGRVVRIGKAKTHLNGKNVTYDLIEEFPPGIKKGEPVLIVSGNSTGYGVTHASSEDFYRVKKENEGESAGMSTKSDEEIRDAQILKVKNITSEDPAAFQLSEKTPSMEDVVAANKEHIKALGKNAMNTIKGAVNLKDNKDKPVFVSFSGGKDSLVVLDLAASALVHRPFTAVFLNTGIDYPETVEFARAYCESRNIPFKEMSAGDDFWKTLKEKDHPTKDSRWCCKVCKLNSSNRLAEGKPHLSLDGKRRQESFMRSRIPTMDTNPNVEGQLNIFPIRDWRASEVWLYIHWRKLPYNSLYDNGLERIGCWMCPAAFQAEYERMRKIHPELAGRWETYLSGWAKKTGVSDEFVKHGFWRWEQLPPKMIKLAEELKINIERNDEL
ncbi:Phosphoadenosine phosphosulfate reductase [Methanimicrococcus sp. At1]|uniref:Phosphoadenosine phosphosulfate reductase n=1 Tax=Methanimicrococcus hacksteinii TaxID=3028293 RepID=A0ABU3VQ95_9EURY|nr:phosphoadenosine phosphosulfate reductase family protein [Methanimicrococcus sp. At1]MDV0445573.1 Phosphoadenosine phosphosulfate reductase [Methanimicrococcus sp. At1]